MSWRDYCHSRVSQGDAAGKETTHDNGFPDLRPEKEPERSPLLTSVEVGLGRDTGWTDAGKANVASVFSFSGESG